MPDSKLSPQDYFNSVEHFCQCTDELLKLEREAELEESRSLQENVSPKQLEKKGVCITKLSIEGRKTSLYGRLILTLKPSNVNKTELPSHNITTGDIVGLHMTSSTSAQISSGIVNRVSSTQISVAFDQSEELSNLGDDSQYYIIKLANDVTYRRLRRTLDKMNKSRSLPADGLIGFAFTSTSDDVPLRQKDQISFFNSNLDDSQKKAVHLALSQPRLAIIHGPPGTGKSTTIIEVIRQLVCKGLKVLACAPSNVAVDNLVLRLSKAKTKVTRLGHPARAMHEIQQHSLDVKVSASDESSIVEDIRKDIDATLKKMRQGRGGPGHQSSRNELKSLRSELRQRSDEAVRRVLKHSEVILSTLTSATDDGPLRILEDMHFDVVVIDECSQALEAACWIALIQAPKCILAGDHLQLPPTILSHRAASLGLSVTLMERLIPHHPSHVHMLTVQYRMNSRIMQWASEELYSNKLTAADSVADHLLKDIPGVTSNEVTSEALLLIDTSGCDLQELDLPDEQSRGNEGEADLVAIHVESLVEAGVNSQDIAIISPYNLQVELIRNRLSDKYKDLEIKSVDGYQGREKEAVIISLVRSNIKGEVGFLSEDRRLNVAVTRARRQVTIICDSETVSKHAFLSRLIQYMNKHGVVKSAAEYQIDHDIGKISDKVADMMKNKSTSEPSSSKTEKSSKSGQARKPKSKKVATVSITSTDAQISSTNLTSRPSSSFSAATHQQSSDSATATVETEEEREARIREEMQLIVYRFVCGEETIHHLSADLNSYQRMITHQIAESYGLEHSSKGDGADRHIVLKKPAKTKSEKLDRELSCAEITDQTCDNNVQSQQVPAAIPTDMTTCDLCGYLVTKSNLTLHQLRCSTNVVSAETHNSSRPPLQNSTRPKSTTNDVNRQANSAKQKKKKKEKRTINDEAILNKVDDDDFDALLAAADRLNSQCNYKKCKTLVKTLGTNCAHCNLRFCLTHGIPEVHGCGEAAKVQARINISKEGKIYSGSGAPNKKPNAVRRAQLERKLQSKMDKFTEQRKPKEKDKS